MALIKSLLIAGGLKESKSAPAGFPGPKLGTRDGGANSTLIEGGAICDACPISAAPPFIAIISSVDIPYISVGAAGNCEFTLPDR